MKIVFKSSIATLQVFYIVDQRKCGCRHKLGNIRRITEPDMKKLKLPFNPLKLGKAFLSKLFSRAFQSSKKTL